MLLPFIKLGYYNHPNHMKSSIGNVENTEFPAVRVQRLPVSVETKHGKLGSTEQFQIQIYLFTPDF